MLYGQGKPLVIPAKAGIHFSTRALDPGVRRDDEQKSVNSKDFEQALRATLKKPQTAIPANVGSVFQQRVALVIHFDLDFQGRKSRWMTSHSAVEERFRRSPGFQQPQAGHDD